MFVSEDQFRKMFPEAISGWYEAFESACNEFQINTPARLAMFFAQLAHESNRLTRLEESFRYKPERLMEIFPFAFRTIEVARDYVARGAEAIASRAYANRMGNGGEASKDGWKHRGKFPMQLTGANNYDEFGRALMVDLVKAKATDPVVGARVSARFFKTRGCNELSDQGKIQAVTRAINGGLNGLKERTTLWNQFKQIIPQGLSQ